MKLELALARYTDALTKLKWAKSEPSEIEILHILVAREAIEEALSEKTQLFVESLAKLLELDNFLKQQAHAIAFRSKFGRMASYISRLRRSLVLVSRTHLRQGSFPLTSPRSVVQRADYRWIDGVRGLYDNLRSTLFHEDSVSLRPLAWWDKEGYFSR